MAAHSSCDGGSGSSISSAGISSSSSSINSNSSNSSRLPRGRNGRPSSTLAARALLAAAAVAAAAAAAEGPCDLFAAGGTPCVAAHSVVRALFGAYAGALYQVNRTRDGALFDVNVLAPGGFADAAAQDAFCNASTSAAGEDAPPLLLPPLGSTVRLTPALMERLSFRHCDGQGFVTPNEVNDDHDFVLVQALSGDAGAVSLRSVNYPTYFVGPVATAEPGRLGVVEAPVPEDASWIVTPAPIGGGSVIFTLVGRGGMLTMAIGTNLTGSCAGNYAAPSASVYLEPSTASTPWLVAAPPGPPPPPPCVISKIYDQTALRNDLGVGPAGGNGRADTPVSATGMRVSVGGNAVYAAVFNGGEGYRNDTTTGVAVGNEPETIYMVTSGKHFNDGCESVGRAGRMWCTQGGMLQSS